MREYFLLQYVGNLHRIAHSDWVEIFRLDCCYILILLVYSAGIRGSHSFSIFILDTVGEFHAQIAQIPRRVAGDRQLEIEELKSKRKSRQFCTACSKMDRKKTYKVCFTHVRIGTDGCDGRHENVFRFSDAGLFNWSGIRQR